MTKIRYIIGGMPYDSNGRHATGREVWSQAAAGNWCWMPEYEGDDTVDLPETETQREYDARWLDWLYPNGI